MALTNKLIVISLAAGLLAGCTGLKQMTGQIDNTKLPGQREDILPPSQQQARDPAITGQPLPPDPMAQKVATSPGASVPQPPQAPGAALPQAGAPGAAMPKVAAPNGQEAITDVAPKAGTDCDPKVDLCPQQLKPEPLPPPSPLKVEKPVTTAKVATKASTKKTVKKVVKKKKKSVAEPIPPEPKDDAPPAPGPAVPAAPAPQGQ